MPQDPQNEPPESRDLREAIQGLKYPSESDAPVDAFLWKATDPRGGSGGDLLAARAGRAARIEEVSLDRFFADLANSEDADRFRRLRRVIELRLKGPAVYRVDSGNAEVDIYILGQTVAGDWAGVHTISVET